MNKLFFILSDVSASTSGETSNSNSSTEKLAESLTAVVKHPAFYIVIGCLVLLIIAVYFIRRIVKPTHNEVKVVVRKGKIYKLINENSSKYFMVPFVDSLSAIVSLNEKEFTSDKLFINNGPDALYKINYTLTYKVVNVEQYFQYRESFQKIIEIKMNDDLREYADKGHALDIVKDYRNHNSNILSIVNKTSQEYGAEATSIKFNYIEPLGKK